VVTQANDSGAVSDDEAEANARLIAACEALAAMCYYLKHRGCLREPARYTEECPYEPTTEGAILMNARAAIAAAKGGEV
jgi:hypothetical protein